jgi:hypothetical protein
VTSSQHDHPAPTLPHVDVAAYGYGGDVELSTARSLFAAAASGCVICLDVLTRTVAESSVLTCYVHGLVYDELVDLAMEPGAPISLFLDEHPDETAREILDAHSDHEPSKAMEIAWAATSEDRALAVAHVLTSWRKAREHQTSS